MNLLSTPRLRVLGATGLAFAVTAGLGTASVFAAGQQQENTTGPVVACFNNTTGAVRLRSVNGEPIIRGCNDQETRVRLDRPGARGPAGAQGDAGPRGATGQDGADGAPGEQGPTGEPGTDGTDGAAGPEGSQGPAGERGPAGPSGTDGEDGARGPAGTDGEDGENGARGPAGADGAQGPQGLQGPQGPQGPAGPGTELFGQDTSRAANGRGADCVLGEVLLTAGRVAGRTTAAGQILSVQSNQALFALLGTDYGGNGTTTFALPDLRQEAPNGLTYVICTQGIFPSRE